MSGMMHDGCENDHILHGRWSVLRYELLFVTRCERTLSRTISKLWRGNINLDSVLVTCYWMVSRWWRVAVM
jgi:hypothetical protein